MVKAKGTAGRKAKKQSSAASNNEARQTALQLRELKKSFKSELASLKSDFKNKMKAVAATAYQKALADMEREVTKRAQAKAKLLRDTAANFDKQFQSKLATHSAAKPAKKAKAASKKRSRSAKK